MTNFDYFYSQNYNKPMNNKDYDCIVGESDFRDFSQWWEGYLPAYIVVYCKEGNAMLNLHFEPYSFSKGMMAIISYDMFPSISDISDDFNAAYCLFDRDFGDQIFYEIPSNHFDLFYWHPVAETNAILVEWLNILFKTHAETEYICRKELLSNAIKCLFICGLNLWKERFGDMPVKHKMNNLEEICTKFYNLVFDHFKIHRDTTFYAELLHISPNYLAIVLRNTINESPKQVIDRQVILEIKQMLRKTSMTIAEIAHELNFPDTSYLCRYFRRNTGMAVSEFRLQQ